MKLATNKHPRCMQGGGKSAAVKSLEQLSRHIKVVVSTDWSNVKVHA